MVYTELHNQLLDQISFYNKNQKIVRLNDYKTDIHILNFKSSKPEQLSEFLGNSKRFREIESNKFDENIKENYNFSYPAFIPRGENKYDRVILMLHGLNERRWDKYLTWALFLSNKIRRPVILFPISYHINRSPLEWSDPRKMTSLAKSKKTRLQNTSDISFANIALSNRLTKNPLKFFVSGFQSASDILRLVNDIKNGRSSFLRKNTHIDIFAYSIGAFLAEILMTGNPDDLFTSSKLFMFCGGSVFSGMNGSSKLIMDNLAYLTIYDYYMNEFENEIDKGFLNIASPSIKKLINSFRSLIDIDRFRYLREKDFKRLRNQIFALGLKKDSVIPEASIRQTLGKGLKNAIKIMDFPYQYRHENPFPLNNKNIEERRIIDRSFNIVMKNAAAFLY